MPETCGGVVRDHAADGACGPGGRVGAELVAVGCQVVVDHHDGRAGYAHLLPSSGPQSS